MPRTADPITARFAPSRVRIVAADGRRHLISAGAREQIMLWATLLLAGEPGVVELTPGSRNATGRLELWRTRKPHCYGPAGDPAALADRAVALTARGLEVFCSPLAHAAPLPGSAGVTGGRVLWADLDDERGLARLIAFEPRPCLIVASGGALGKAHGYWRLERRLPGQALEAANRRLARALQADGAVSDRGRVLRLPGSINGKSGQPCRLLYADLRPGRHALEAIAGPETAPSQAAIPPVRLGPPRRFHGAPDALRDVEPAAYFHALCGVAPDAAGFVNCPLPDHDDATPSCRLYPTADLGWWCFGCRRGGRIYDLASLLLGGPWGRDLRGEPFRAARALVHERLGLAPLAR